MSRCMWKWKTQSTLAFTHSQLEMDAVQQVERAGQFCVEFIKRWANKTIYAFLMAY